MYRIRKNKGMLTDCPVAIYDEDNNYLAETIIESHDSMNMHVYIPDVLNGIASGTRLVLLALLPDHPREFSGIAKGMFNKMREVSIYNERSAERRSAVRHKIKSPAVIKHIVVDSELTPICPILGVTVENISTIGIMFNSPPGFFDVGSIVEVDININGQDVLLYADITRVQQSGDNSFSYGCKLIFHPSIK